METYKVIQELESDNSRKFKESVIERESDAKNTELFEGISMALDKLRTFGLKQVPESQQDGPGLHWDTFLETTTQLENRSLTGNAARDRVDYLMALATQAEWNSWYRRILIKDLRCGVTEKTVNKFSDYPVPVFDCMLADDSKKHEKKMTGEVLVEPKFDGVRVLAVCDVDKDEITLYSRNGKELTNFPLIKLNLDTVILEQLEQSVVLDGEVMSDDFQTLMREIHRKDGAKTDDAVLNLFDIVPLADFVQGKSKLTLLQRKEMLEGLKLPVNVKTVEYVRMNLSDEDGQKQFADYNKLCIDRGYEGIMIKPADGIYECKRSALWLKVKPFIEVSLKVIAVEEGTGRNAGKLGALIVEGTDMDKFIRTNVGSGLTDENREEYWKARDKLIGQIVEVRADAITQNQEADGEYSLRFPRFLRFRGFDIGEKL
jgi:DNA ligase-1